MNAVPGISGIGLLPNGDGVVCTWGGSQLSNGEVWIIPNLASGTPGTPTRITTGMREPLGVAVVGNDFYVMEKPRINRYVGSGTTWTRTTLWSLPTAWYNDAQWHHFSFNLIYHNSYLWFATGTAYDYDANDPLQRGALIRVPLAGGSFQQMARGLRNPFGISLGIDGEFFATDNQGHWKPHDMMYHIPVTGTLPTNGRFFGFRTNGNNACGITVPNTVPILNGGACANDPEYPPAVWIPYPFSNSPTRLVVIPGGPYAGQMLAGDVYHGGVFRYFMEKMPNGEYQGAVFQFQTGGTTAGVGQIITTPGGNFIATGLGGGTCGLGGSGNWNWIGTCRGLDLLSPNGTVPFEPLAIRALATGFEIEFTQITENVAAVTTPGNYIVRTTGVTPVQAYGVDGNTGDNNIAVTVTSVTRSTDGRKVTLQLGNLQLGRMYSITLNTAIRSSTAQTLYNTVGYYTVNTVGPAAVPVKPKVEALSRNFRILRQGGTVFISLPYHQPYQVALFNLGGRKVAGVSGSQPGTLSTAGLKPGVYFMAGKVGETSMREKIRVD